MTASPSTLEESRERLGEPRQSGGGFPVRKVQPAEPDLCDEIVGTVLGLKNPCQLPAGHEGPHVGIDTKTTTWAELYGPPRERKHISVEAQVELAERLKAERPGYRLGDQVHGPWCELIHEENRWWEAFNQALNPAARAYLRASEQRKFDQPLPVDSTAERCAERAAVIADAAIAAAKKRNRL